MNALITTIMLMAVVGACESDERCIDESKINKDAICTMEYNPVCGCDGKTYSNSCMAKNAGVVNWEEGACTKDDR